MPDAFSPLILFIFSLSLSVLLFLLLLQENDWLINGANNILSKCLQGCMHCACYFIQESGKAGHLFCTHNPYNNYPADYFFVCEPSRVYRRFLCWYNCITFFSFCWTVWWDSYEAGRRLGVNSHTATTAITLIIALHLANLDAFVSPCCTNSKITHTIHHYGCWWYVSC